MQPGQNPARFMQVIHSIIGRGPEVRPRADYYGPLSFSLLPPVRVVAFGPWTAILQSLQGLIVRPPASRPGQFPPGGSEHFPAAMGTMPTVQDRKINQLMALRANVIYNIQPPTLAPNGLDPIPAAPGFDLIRIQGSSLPCPDLTISSAFT
jgi:hypothetical protein